MTRESSQFSEYNRLRSRLFHGSVRTVTLQQINLIKTLLEKSLAKEFGIDDLVRTRHSGPTLLELALTYATVLQRNRPSR